VYAKEAVYDDPWSFCDTRFKIAGQWYGLSPPPFLPPPPPPPSPPPPPPAPPRENSGDQLTKLNPPRHTQDHGLLAHARHRDRALRHRHPVVQDEAGIQAAAVAGGERSQQPGDADAGWGGEGGVS